METVQSDIASEKPGIFDVFQEGLYRLLSWSPPQTGSTNSFLDYVTIFQISLLSSSGRLLPIWIILCPAVLCGTFHYVSSVLSTGLARWGIVSTKKKMQRKQVCSLSVNSVILNDALLIIYHHSF